MPLQMITYKNPGTFLDTLPTEILQYIASYLTQCDIISLNRTSKAIYRDTTRDLYRKLDIKGGRQFRALKKTVSTNLHVAKYTTHITLEDRTGPTWERNEGRLCRLRSFLGAPWTNLKVLTIQTTPMQPGDALVIERLTTDIVKAVLAQPQLEQVAFGFCRFRGYPSAPEILGVLHHPNLRTITLSGFGVCSDKTMKYLKRARCVETRKSLHLRLCECRLGGRALRALLNHVSKPGKFSLFDSEFISRENEPLRDEDIISYMEALRLLKVDLEGLTFIYDELLINWRKRGFVLGDIDLREFKELKHLYVDDMFLTILHTYGGYKDALPSNLEHLSIQGFNVREVEELVKNVLRPMRDAIPHFKRISIRCGAERIPQDLVEAAAAAGVSIDTGEGIGRQALDVENW